MEIDIDDENLFRSGKHLGKTIGWVKKNDPDYFDWVYENVPKMLTNSRPKPEPKEVKINAPEWGKLYPSTKFWDDDGTK